MGQFILELDPYFVNFHLLIEHQGTSPLKALRKLFFFFLVGWGLNSGLCVFIAGSLPFELHITLVILEMGFSQTFCPGWPQTMILLISGLQV
jgi:hypothetical protein